MANVKFAYGSKTSLTTSTSGFDDGCIYFGTSAKKIWLRQGSSVYTFDGNNTNTNNIPGYSTTGSSTYTSYANCNIQNLPQYKSGVDYNSSYTGTPWFSWIGQNVASAYSMIDASYDFGFDYTMQGYKNLPPLEYAKEIIVAVDTYHLARAANNGTTPTNGGNVFSYYPEECIVHCYRTGNSAYAADTTDNYSYDSSGAMFSGYTHLSGIHSSSSSNGASTNVTRVDVELCLNGTNAINVVMKGFIINSGSDTNKSCSVYATSAKHTGYDDYGSYYSNIERHVYPLAIRYI